MELIKYTVRKGKTMLKIEKTVIGKTATLSPEGRLDTLTAPEMEAAILEVASDVDELTLDLSKLEYVSSAGLRVLMMTHKTMLACGGKMTVVNPNTIVKGVFDMTGISEVFNVA